MQLIITHMEVLLLLWRNLPFTAILSQLHQSSLIPILFFNGALQTPVMRHKKWRTKIEAQKCCVQYFSSNNWGLMSVRFKSDTDIRCNSVKGTLFKNNCNCCQFQKNIWDRQWRTNWLLFFDYLHIWSLDDINDSWSQPWAILLSVIDGQIR